MSWGVFFFFINFDFFLFISLFTVVLFCCFLLFMCCTPTPLQGWSILGTVVLFLAENLIKDNFTASKCKTKSLKLKYWTRLRTNRYIFGQAACRQDKRKQSIQGASNPISRKSYSLRMVVTIGKLPSGAPYCSISHFVEKEHTYSRVYD